MNETNQPKQYDFMRRVLALAAQALEEGELPIAAILVLNDKIIAQAATTEKRERRLLGHAEMRVLEIADKTHLSMEQRRRTALYTNLEPCMMCMGACMSFCLGEIIYSLESPGDGAVKLVETWARKEDDFPGYQTPRITGGILREESIRLFKQYVNRQQPGPMRDWAETLARL